MRCLGLGVAVVGGAVVLACGGCSSSRSCSMVGAESGVRVVLPRPWPTQTVAVTACVGRDCRWVRSEGIDGPVAHSGVVYVPHPALTTQPIRVNVTIGDDAGRVVATGSGVTDASSKLMPNGPGCEPTVYGATVTANPVTH